MSDIFQLEASTRFVWWPYPDENGRTVMYELDEDGEVVAEIRCVR